MKKILLIIIVFWTASIRAQNPEGLSVRFGINTAYPKWNHVNLLFREYAELRPWLTVKPEMTELMGGWNIGYALSGERFWFDMDYMSNRNSMRYKGIDSMGVEQKGTFALIDRSISLSAGFKFVDTPIIRMGLFSALSFHPMVIKQASNFEYATTFAAWLLTNPFKMSGSVHPIDTKMFLAAKIGASIQIGNRFGVTYEPYYMLPFWKTDFKSTRDELNVNTTSAYSDEQFKDSLKHWGMRFIFYLGVFE